MLFGFLYILITTSFTHIYSLWIAVDLNNTNSTILLSLELPKPNWARSWDLYGGQNLQLV